MAENDDEVDGSREGESGSERRETKRVHISSVVDVRDVADLMTGAGVDVGVGGLYVVTPHELPEGTLLEVAFTLGEIDRSFAVLGEVRWCRDQPVGDEDRYGVGIEFVDLDPGDRDALESFVERHEPIEADDRPHDDAEDAEDAAEEGRLRRQSGRVPISARVTMKTVANLTSALGSDLSAGGIYVVMPEKYRVGSYLDLEFTVEGVDRTFEVLGEVRRHQPHPIGYQKYYGLGIEFVDLDRHQQKHLESFTDRREPIDPEQRFEKSPEED